MNNNLIFFLSATLIVVLSIAALSTGVIINKSIDTSNSIWLGTSSLINTDNWGTLNCQRLSDQYEDDEKDWEKMDGGDTKNQKKKDLDHLKQQINSCNRRKAFYGLEYSALIIDVCGGFICSILGLLLYLNEGKSFSTKIGIIGLVFGAVGFIMTVVYFIYSILVYTKDGDKITKAESDGSYASLVNNEYKHTFYEEKDIYSMTAKYCEYGKKQYNYNKEFYLSYLHESFSELYQGTGGCVTTSTPNFVEKVSSAGHTYANSKPCLKLYIEPTSGITNKNMSDRWLTTIILTAIIILCSICLAIFGFLLFKNKDESTSGEVKVA